MNQTLTLETLGDFIVTGVLRDLDLKSHFRFDVLVSFATIPSLENKSVIKVQMSNWKSMSRYYTYVPLNKQDDRSTLEAQSPEFVKAIFPEPEQGEYGFKVQPLLDINLGINLANYFQLAFHIRIIYTLKYNFMENRVLITETSYAMV